MVYSTLFLFCILYYIYKYTHTHTWFLSTLVCSYSRALCYCFAFAASTTPPQPACCHLVRNRIVPLALMPSAFNIVSCFSVSEEKQFGPTWQKILRILKVIVVYNWHRFISNYVCVSRCVHSIHMYMYMDARETFEICYGPRLCYCCYLQRDL